MGNYVRVPAQDWQNICNSVRGKTGGEALLLSGEVSPAIDGIQSGGGEKILYMDAALLNAGGAYPADVDDYTTAVIPAEATFVDYEVFDNLPLIDTVIINGDCEFEVYEEYNSSSKSYSYYSPFTKNGYPLKKIVVKDRTTLLPQYFMMNAKTNFVLELKNCSGTGLDAFRSCGEMRKATFTNVATIGDNAFFYCQKLKSIAFTDGLITIGSGAFDRCLSLTGVVLPDSVTTIGSSAFYNCNLTEITIPTGVKEIADFAFYGNANLASVTIPEGVTSLGTYCFYGAAFQSLTIPASVTSIGADAVEISKVIRGYAGSYAETWAAENGYTFEVIE